MSELQPITTVVASTELEKSAKARAREILSNTPVVALPHGGMGKRVDTDAELLDTLEHIVGSLKFWMAQQAEAADELAALKRDLAATGRVFKLITQAEQ